MAGASNDGLPVEASANLQFEALFLDGELRQFRALHEINDLLNLL